MRASYCVSGTFLGEIDSYSRTSFHISAQYLHANAEWTVACRVIASERRA